MAALWYELNATLPPLSSSCSDAAAAIAAMATAGPQPPDELHGEDSSLPEQVSWSHCTQVRTRWCVLNKNQFGGEAV